MSTSFDLTAPAILRVAYQLVGVVTAGSDPDVNQLSLGYDLLNMGLKALQSDGIMLSMLERTTTTLVAGQAQYTTAADTLDIDGGQPYVTAFAGGDFPLTMQPRAAYMALTDKATQSQPTLMYVEKSGAGVSFFLWPVPDSSWSTITYPRIKLLNDQNATTATGLPSKYLKAVTYMVAADLAFHHGLMQKQQALREQFLDEKQRARGDDTERGSVRFVPDYGMKFRSRF